jgi:hypothetical protein
VPRRLLGRRDSRRQPTRPIAARPALQRAKLDAIDFAIRRLGITSIADLGGVWAVEAGYTFHALSHPQISRAVLVDSGITPTVRERAASEPRLTLVEADITSAAATAAVGEVDAVLLFDVLLHQVDPDWDQVLAIWSEHCTSFVIVNPQRHDGDEAVRLIDLGPVGYAAHTPLDHIPVPWDALDEVDPRYDKPTRDVHEYWQWGIPDAALHRVMTNLGYRAILYADYGPWHNAPGYDYRVFVYTKVVSATRAPGTV